MQLAESTQCKFVLVAVTTQQDEGGASRCRSKDHGVDERVVDAMVDELGT